MYKINLFRCIDPKNHKVLVLNENLDVSITGKLTSKWLSLLAGYHAGNCCCNVDEIDSKKQNSLTHILEKQILIGKIWHIAFVKAVIFLSTNISETLLLKDHWNPGISQTKGWCKVSFERLFTFQSPVSKGPIKHPRETAWELKRCYLWRVYWKCCWQLGERKEHWARSLHPWTRLQLWNVLGVSHRDCDLATLSISFHYIMTSTITLRTALKTKWLGKNMKIFFNSALCKY